jgi:alkylhydroperoxidase family enzyme
MLADKVSRVPEAVTEAILSGAAIPEPKLAALSAFTSRMLSSRGLSTAADVRTFLGAGYSERQVLEVILAIAVKTLSNFANHLFHTPIDDMFVGSRTKAA